MHGQEEIIVDDAAGCGFKQVPPHGKYFPADRRTGSQAGLLLFDKGLIFPVTTFRVAKGVVAADNRFGTTDTTDLWIDNWIDQRLDRVCRIVVVGV